MLISSKYNISEKGSLCDPHFKIRENFKDMGRHLLKASHPLSEAISLFHADMLKGVRFKINDLTEVLQFRLCKVETNFHN